MKKIILCVLVLYSAYTYAGGTVNIKGHRFVIVPYVGGIWQGNFLGDIGLAHAYDIHYVEHEWWQTTLAYSKLGAEVSINSKSKFWAPKFSSEIDWKFFCLRGNVEDYIEAGKNYFYGTPEIGLTLSGFITLSGGYNKPLFKNRVNIIPPFRISLSFLLPLKM